MKKIFTLAVATIFWVNGFGQAPAIQWQKCLGGSSDDIATCVIQTIDGGYVVAGITSSSDGDVTANYGNGDYWIVKLNAIGALLWQRHFGGGGGDWARSIQQTTDGGFIIAGNSDSNNFDVTCYHGSDDFLIVKLDSVGTLQWRRCLGGTGIDYAYAVQQTTDGGYVAAGYTESNDFDVSGYHGGLSDCWVVKLDSAGTLQWQKCLGGTNEDEANSIQQTSDGGYIVACYTFSNDMDVSGNHGSRDYWIVKLDNAGNLQWQKCLGGTFQEIPYCIQQTTDGGYIVVGFTASLDGDVTVNHGSFDYWVVKLDNSGTLQWQKCFGGTNADAALWVQQTNDFGYVVAGFTLSNDSDVSGNHGSKDYWIIKLDTAGSLQWQKCYGGTGDDRAWSIMQTIDGGFITAGFSFSNDDDVTGNHGTDDYWVVKLAPNIQTNNYAGTLSNSGIILSPNPFHETATLTFGTNSFEEGTLEIKNVLGEAVQQPRHFTGNTITLHRNNLPAGIYFCSLIGKGNKRVYGKFIVD